MISVQNLYKSFGPNQVLNGLNISFEPAGIFAILGPNSSGKTTLIKSILGMVIPQQGTISLEGRSIKNEWKYRENIGYLPQIARFPENLTVNELLRMIMDLRSGSANQWYLIELFELQPFLDQRLGNLSGGTRQKVNIVQAFMYDSPLLILDEPTTGLDPIALIRFKELLHVQRKKGRLILITTHIMSLVDEIADELIFLLEGKIHFRGKPAEMKLKYGASDLERAIANMLRGEQPIHSNGDGRIGMEDSTVDSMANKERYV